jgi:DNA ligase-1
LYCFVRFLSYVSIFYFQSMKSGISNAERAALAALASSDFVSKAHNSSAAQIQSHIATLAAAVVAGAPIPQLAQVGKVMQPVAKPEQAPRPTAPRGPLLRTPHVPISNIELTRRNLSPMLAFPWDKYCDRIAAKEDLFVSPKLDGIRCIVGYDVTTKRPYFLSRNLNEFDSTDGIGETMMEAFRKDPQLVFDGELYNHHLRFGDIVSGVKATKNRRTNAHLDLQHELQFHAFDLLYAKGIAANTPFTLRRNAMDRALQSVVSQSAARVVLVEHQQMKKSGVDAALQRAIDDGYEGVMVRVGDTPYAYGRRSSTILKHKLMQDDEFEIVEVLEGTKRLADKVGAIRCVTNGPERLKFKASFHIDDDSRAYWWKHRHSLLGKMATVQFQELTDYGVPRFGVFKAVRGTKGGQDFI